MGIVRSLRGLINKLKKNENKERDKYNEKRDNLPPGILRKTTNRSKNSIKRNQSLRAGIYEPYRSHFPLKQTELPRCSTGASTNGKIGEICEKSEQKLTQTRQHGGYNPNAAKLVTANGTTPLLNPKQNHSWKGSANFGNYEQFDWRQSNTSLNSTSLTNFNGNYQMHQPNMNRHARYGSLRSMSGLQIFPNTNPALHARNSALMSSTRSLREGPIAAFTTQQIQDNQNKVDARISHLRGQIGSGSVTSLSSVAASISPNDRPARPSSALGTMSRSYSDWDFSQGQQQRPLASASNSYINFNQLNLQQHAQQQQQQQVQRNVSMMAAASYQQQQAAAAAAELARGALGTWQKQQQQQVVPGGAGGGAAGGSIQPSPHELTEAMRKMEACLEMLNSIQYGAGGIPAVGGQQVVAPGGMRNAGSPNRAGGVMSGSERGSPVNLKMTNSGSLTHIPTFQQLQHQRQQQQLKQQLHDIPRRTFEPQPEFQEREKKKRRARRKSEILKSDIYGQQQYQPRPQSNSNNNFNPKQHHHSRQSSQLSNDVGFYEGESSGSGSDNATNSDGERASSTSSSSAYNGSDGSDSGVVTPPPDTIQQKMRAQQQHSATLNGGGDGAGQQKQQTPLLSSTTSLFKSLEAP